MDQRETFQNAAAEFERQYRCRLCLHDYTGRLPHDLLPSYHLNPCCTGVKLKWKNAERQCVAFDRNLVQERLAFNPVFLLKSCPYGLIEGIFPVLKNDRIAGCIFAGPFRRGQPESENGILKASASHELRIRAKTELPELPADLRGFRAQGELLAFCLALISEVSRSAMPQGDRNQIERLLEQNFHRNIGLNDAAALLTLSPARASNRIRKLFGKGFCSLLREYRLNAAEKLLEQSCFTVEEIARRCGFRDGAYFHRVFRKAKHLTPVEYRNRNQYIQT